MAVREFGVRELRNHTADVLRTVEEGDSVFLTNRGVRVAEIRPVRAERPIDRLLKKAAHISAGDTGAFEALMDSKHEAIAAQIARDAELWG